MGSMGFRTWNGLETADVNSQPGVGLGLGDVEYQLSVTSTSPTDTSRSQLLLMRCLKDDWSLC